MTQACAANCTVKHSVIYHISTTGPPIPSHTSPHSGTAQHGQTRIRSHSGSWHYPPVIMQLEFALGLGTKEGTRGLAIIWAVNRVTRYPILHLHNFTSTMQGATTFSHIHLVQAFHQTPWSPKTHPETAITTTPIQLVQISANASHTFQRFINEVLRVFIIRMHPFDRTWTLERWHEHDIIINVTNSMFAMPKT